jgi:hypothetical protein
MCLLKLAVCEANTRYCHFGSSALLLASQLMVFKLAWQLVEVVEVSDYFDKWAPVVVEVSDYYGEGHFLFLWQEAVWQQAVQRRRSLPEAREGRRTLVCGATVPAEHGSMRAEPEVSRSPSYRFGQARGGAGPEEARPQK